MWLGDKWRAYQTQRARRFLQAHSDLALVALRQDPALGSQALLAASALFAARTPDRETIQYPILNQMGFGARKPLQQSLPKPSPFNLRRFSEYPPSRRAINALTNPLLDLPWEIQLVPPMDKEQDHTPPDPNPDQHRRILAATRMLQEPNDDDGWRTLLEMVTEDVIVGGYGAIEVQATGDIERPLFLWGVDGQSIRINALWNGDANEPRYSQSLGYVGISVGTHEQVMLKDEELLYIKLNPRTNTPFGFGYLESAYVAVNAWLGAFEFAERRASNSTPPYAIFTGENETPERVRAFRNYWESEIEGYGKIPILGGGKSPSVLSFTGTGEDPLWLQWQDYLIRVIAMAFGLSPMKLGLERDVNYSTANVQQQDDWTTVAPIAETIADAITRRLLWKRLGWRDLTFAWQVKTSDELRQAQILAAQYEMNGITVDEIREIYERPALPDGLGDMTKSAYEAVTKMAAMPQPQTPPADGTPVPAQAGRGMPRVVLPMDDDEPLSPKARAFLRALMQERQLAGAA